MKEMIMYYSTYSTYVKVKQEVESKSDLFDCMLMPENTKTVYIARSELIGRITVIVIGPDSESKSRENICEGKFTLDIKEPILA
jgi:hypothetical protein